MTFKAFIPVEIYSNFIFSLITVHLVVSKKSILLIWHSFQRLGGSLGVILIVSYIENNLIKIFGLTISASISIEKEILKLLV